MNSKKNRTHHFHIRMNLQRRLLSAFFIVAVPILTIVFLASYIIIHASDRARMRSEQKAALNSLSRQFEFIIEDTKTLSKDIIFNSHVQENLTQALAGKKIISTADTAYFVNNFIANRDYVDSVVLTGIDGTLYSTERAFTDVSSFASIEKKNWYPRLINLDEPYLWVLGEDQVLFARKIYSLTDYTTLLGYEMIYIDPAYMESLWDTCTFGQTTNIAVTDSSGALLLANGFARASETSYLSAAADDTNAFIASTYPLSRDGWILSMVTPYREVNENMIVLQAEILALLAIILLILVLISLTSARAMAKPINALARTMDVFHGEDSHGSSADLSRYRNRQDEVGQIYRSYENMVERMDFMIKDIYIKTLEKRDAELALMQSQINPHFLYNTLDSINWMALANGQEEISDMVMALSDTFRLSLTKSNSPFIRLSDEMEYISSYLLLQKYRYKDKLIVYYDIEERCNELYIPRFICQPIVENAIKHGLSKLPDSGELFVQAMRDEDACYINIINDGIGIDSDQIHRHLDFNPDKMEYLAFENGGYGLQNIHRRIRIMCGAPYGISFREIREEDEPIKTVCTITLPIRHIPDGIAG